MADKEEVGDVLMKGIHVRRVSVDAERLHITLSTNIGSIPDKTLKRILLSSETEWKELQLNGFVPKDELPF